MRSPQARLLGAVSGIPDPGHNPSGLLLQVHDYVSGERARTDVCGSSKGLASMCCRWAGHEEEVPRPRFDVLLAPLPEVDTDAASKAVGGGFGLAVVVGRAFFVGRSRDKTQPYSRSSGSIGDDTRPTFHTGGLSSGARRLRSVNYVRLLAAD